MLKEKYSDTLFCEDCNQLLVKETDKLEKIISENYFKIITTVLTNRTSNFKVILVLEGKFLNLTNYLRISCQKTW